MSFLVLKYQGQEISRDIDRKVYRETWIGDSASIDGVISGLTIGTLTQGKGYLRAWTKKQDEGEHYTAELEYSETFTSDFSDESGTTVGKRSATLSTRTVQLPIEKATGYKTNWNYYLISTLQLSPLWWTTATNTIIPVADRKNYMWIKNLSEMPIEANANGQYWNVCAEPTKPGVQYFDVSYFVITISAKYNTATAAGNAVSKSINTIQTPYEDFGLNGGGYNFKLDSAQVRYDGKNWIGTNTYTRSGDSNGWDTDLYH